MTAQTITDALKVLQVAGLHFIYVPQGCGEELLQKLASHGIRRVVQRDASVSFDRLELVGNDPIESVQAVLDEWAA